MSGFAYSNNGLSYRAVEEGWSLAAGEIYFATAPTTEALGMAFPNYAAAVAVMDLAASARALLAGGLAVTSTGDSSLDATYPCDATTQLQTTAEVTSILLDGTFTDGTSSIAWLDASGTGHAFSVDQFKALAKAVGAFVTGCVRCINGQSTTLPSATATIA